MVKNKIKIILEQRTSQFIFLLPGFILLAIILYFFVNPDTSQIIFYFFIVALFLGRAFLLFYRKKLIITPTKIYVYARKEKIISWSFQHQFYMINYRQTLLGKLFNYGTLVLINTNREMYEYYYLHDIEHSYTQIIQTYEKLMKKLDPAFVSSYIEKGTVENIDKIDEK